MSFLAGEHSEVQGGWCPREVAEADTLLPTLGPCPVPLSHLAAPGHILCKKLVNLSMAFPQVLEAVLANY